MSDVRVYVQNVRGMVNREGAQATAHRVARIEVIDLCRKIINQATVDCPVGTGNLRNHHRMRISDESTTVKGSVFNDAEYAAAVERGSSPHTIRARPGGVLRFTIGGETIFARSVRHPGTPPRPWLRQAAERTAVSNGWRFRRITT